MLNFTFGRQLKTAASILTLMGLMSMVPAASADEPCQSPYMAKITGEEQFVYVWTLGIEGVGDGSDKLVTVDVRKGSPTFGKVIDTEFGRWAKRGPSWRIDRRPAPILGRRTRFQAKSSSSTLLPIPRTPNL